jgi:hypothetical protein
VLEPHSLNGVDDDERCICQPEGSPSCAVGEASKKEACEQGQSGCCSDNAVRQCDNSNTISRLHRNVHSPIRTRCIFVDRLDATTPTHARAQTDRRGALSLFHQCFGASRALADAVAHRGLVHVCKWHSSQRRGRRCRTPLCMHVLHELHGRQTLREQARNARVGADMCQPARRSRDTFFDVRRPNSSQAARRR